MAKVMVPVEIPDTHDADEAAALLGKGVATIWRRIKDGSIITIRLGGRTLVPSSEIERIKREKAEAPQ